MGWGDWVTGILDVGGAALIGDPMLGNQTSSLFGGGGSAGGLFSSLGPSLGQQASSGQNIAFQAGQAQMNRDFSAQQAALQRDWQHQQLADVTRFNASQASQQEKFQQMNMAQQQRNFGANMTAAEQYNTMMASTQMQRRMADLKAAGVNPMLAVAGGLGGAAAPNISPMMGAAGGGAAGSVGVPAGAAASAGGAPPGGFPMGPTLASAQQAQTIQSQIQLNTATAQASAARAAESSANAAKIAGVDTAAQKQNIAESQSKQALMALQGDAAAAQANLSKAQTDQVSYAMDKINAEIGQIQSAQNLNEVLAHLKAIDAVGAQLDVDQKRVINPKLVEQLTAAVKTAQLAIPKEQAAANLFSSEIGQELPAWGVVGSTLSFLIRTGAALSK